MKRIYLFPNLITAFALSCGLFVIFKMALLDSQTISYKNFEIGAILVLLAAVADLLDGAVARLVRGESEFGVQFDSLSDAVSFGVVPSVLMLKSLSLGQEKHIFLGAACSAMIYSICGVLRLARYNVAAGSIEKKSEEEILEQKRHFTGLPIPAAAIAAISANLLLFQSSIEEGYLTPQIHAYIAMGIMIFLGYLMVSQWKFPSAKLLRFHVRSFQLVFFAVLSTVLLFYGIFYHFPLSMAFFSWSYIIIALVLAAARLILGKRAASLAEFEPEEE